MVQPLEKPIVFLNWLTEWIRKTERNTFYFTLGKQSVSNFAITILCQSYQYNYFPILALLFLMLPLFYCRIWCIFSPVIFLQPPTCKKNSTKKVPQSRWISCRGQTMPIQARWGERCGKLVYPVAGCFVIWCW